MYIHIFICNAYYMLYAYVMHTICGIHNMQCTKNEVITSAKSNKVV